MTEPTDADRAKAAELCLEMPNGIDLDDIYNTGPFREQVAFIAAALAAERAAAVADLRARVLGLAEEWESEGSGLQARAGHAAWVDGQRALDDAARLRAAVTDTTGDPA